MTLFLQFSKEQNPYLKFGIQLYEDAKGSQIQEELTPSQIISLEKEIMQKLFFKEALIKDPGGGNGNPLQYYLKNSIDRKAYWAVRLQSQTQLKHLSINKRVMKDLIICRRPK